MTKDNSNDRAEQIQNPIDGKDQKTGGREGGTTDTDDEEVFKNDTDAMKSDDLEGLDPDADMEDDDDDLLEPDEEEEDSEENKTLGTP